MEILQWSILIVMVVVIPFLLGMIPVKYMNSLQRTPAMTYICGWFVSFSVFELAAIPFIILQRSFTALVVVYTCILAAILVCSVWRGKALLREFGSSLQEFGKLPIWTRLCWLGVIVLVVIQMAAAIFWEYYDGDDAYYIATAVMTDTFDTMYLRDNYTGYIYSLDIRHALSPTPIYQAWLSRISGIHPTIIAHSVLSAVWLVLMYCIYGQLANRLFPKKKEYRPVFLLLMNIWFLFGNISLYTAETFAMTRTWQGKGMMAGIILPTLLLCLLYLADTNVKKGIWLLFEMVILSAIFATSISFMLIPTLVGVAAVLIAVRKKSVKFFLQMCLCCLPCLVLGGCYLLLR